MNSQNHAWLFVSWKFIFRCLSLIGVLSSPVLADETPTKPNIVVILADDLGSGDVGWRGSDIKTPHLDELAKLGVRLEQFYVQPVCSPTRAALLTGRYPFRYGFQVGVVRPWAEYGLPLEERTLPQALREVGYQTAIVGKWHLGHYQPEYLPTRRGFDQQYGHYNGAIDYYTHIRDGGLDWHRNDQESRDKGYSTVLIGDEASRVVRERDPNRPLFLYVPFNAVHAPLQVPERYLEPYGAFKGNRKTYAGMISAMDEAVGKIVAALREENIFNDTLIFFCSDNGGPNPQKLTDNGPLRAGKGTLYEGGVRVAALAVWPKRLKADSAVEAPLHIVDWHPTLLGLAGASLEQDLPVDGRDIWPTLIDGEPSPHDEIILNIAPQGGALRQGDWKLIVRRPARNAEGQKQGNANELQTELYNLASDSAETQNAANDHPEIVQKLLARYEELSREAVPPKSKPKPQGFQSPKIWGAVSDSSKSDPQ